MLQLQRIVCNGNGSVEKRNRFFIAFCRDSVSASIAFCALHKRVIFLALKILLAAGWLCALIPATVAGQRAVVKCNPINAAVQETGIAVEWRFTGAKTGKPKGIEIEAAWVRPAFQFGDQTFSRLFNDQLQAEGWHAGLYYTAMLPRASRYEDLIVYARLGGYARGARLGQQIFAGSGKAFARYEASVVGMECSWHFPGVFGWKLLEPYAGLGLRFRMTRKQLYDSQADDFGPITRNIIAFPVPALGCRLVWPAYK